MGVPAWTAAAALAVLGIVSFLFPDAPSSLGIGWGLLAIVVAAAVAAVSVLQLRRGRAETRELPRSDRTLTLRLGPPRTIGTAQVRTHFI
jgi:hypothetical protein